MSLHFTLIHTIPIYPQFFANNNKHKTSLSSHISFPIHTQLLLKGIKKSIKIVQTVIYQFIIFKTCLNVIQFNEPSSTAFVDNYRFTSY